MNIRDLSVGDEVAAYIVNAASDAWCEYRVRICEVTEVFTHPWGVRVMTPWGVERWVSPSSIVRVTDKARP